MRTAMRFPVYESLYLLNRNLQEIVGILEQIKKSPGMPRQKFEVYQVEIKFLRSEATQDVLEVMNDAELNEAAKLDRRKRAYYDSIRDLDDVYFEVQHREEERREQGLPPLIGVLPRQYQGPSTEQQAWQEDDESVESGPSKIATRFQGRPTARPRRKHGKEPRQNPQRKRQFKRAT